MPVTPPHNLTKDSGPWARYVNQKQDDHSTKIAQLASSLGTAQASTNNSILQLRAQQAAGLANVYTKGQVDSAIAAAQAAAISSANSYTSGGYSPIGHTHPASDIVSGTLSRPIATTTGNFSTSITSVGARNNQVTTGYVAAYLDTNGVLGFAPSVRRLKTNVSPYATNLTKFLAVPIYSYSYLGDPNNTMHIGPMADDFDAAGLKEFVVYDSAGNMQGLDDKSLLWGLASAYEQSRQSTLTRIANQVFQTATATTPALLLGGNATVTLTFPTAFVDNNYLVTASCTNTALLGNLLVNVIPGSKTTTSVQVYVKSVGVAVAAGQTIYVEAVHS